ncbi:hypothetical protein, partial [Congregibacter sp.]|uniref:hypothetical protein n=1 Tax=Congregibacter sp. TaxID=2744308 RepID=UPI0039E2F9C5
MTDILAWGSEGRSLDVAGNRPLLLNDPEKVYIVQCGSIDVFAVSVVAGKVSGTRSHVFRATHGEALFGMRIGEHDTASALLAVGTIGTQVLELESARFVAKLADLSFVDEATALLNNWCSGLAKGAS